MGPCSHTGQEWAQLPAQVLLRPCPRLGSKAQCKPLPVPPWGPPSHKGLTISVLVGQPVVLAIAVLEVQVPLFALLLAEIGQGVGAVLGVAELEVVGKA